MQAQRDHSRLKEARSRCIHQMIEAASEGWPDALAIICGAEQISFGRLNRRANQLGRHLRALGVGPEVRVGVCLERSVEMVVGVLAILKAGGAYVPLDPAYPLERLALMLEDASIPLLLTQERLEERLPAHWAHTVRIDADWPSIAQEPEENLGTEAEPCHAAYVIYTSGSTGRPKGVVIEHQSVSSLIEALCPLFGLQQEDRVLQFASLSFDASVWEIFASLLSGATLCLTTGGALYAGEELIELLRQEAITLVTLPPSVLKAMPGQAVPVLQRVIAAGEACMPEIIQRWAVGRRFFNAYGPTEATVCATVAECRDVERNPSIGRPIANVEVYVLDQSLSPQAIGVVGEVYIGGKGVARGYLNRPEQTAEQFVPDPKSLAQGERLYKTGDLARLREDGDIEYVGRADHQVKIRGYRIELGEIKALLQQHPAVEEAVVLASDDGQGQHRLIAYVVGRQGVTFSDSQLREYMQKRVAEYMVPALFVRLEAMPLTPNGKIDRLNLPAPESLRPALAKMYVAPRTDLERAIATSWQEALHLPEIGVHDNFFELGGDSLLMVQVHSQLADVFNTDISIMDLFQYPSISSLAKYMSHEPEQKPFAQRSQDRAMMRRESMRRRNPIKEAESLTWNRSDNEIRASAATRLDVGGKE